MTSPFWRSNNRASSRGLQLQSSHDDQTNRVNFANRRGTRRRTIGETLFRTLVFRRNGNPDDRTAIAGFAPAILDPGGRNGPVSALAAIHGIVVFAWLSLFLVQSLFIRSGLLVWHRRLGIASLFSLLLPVALGYQTTIAMIRRGYDLSGDQRCGI